MEYYFCRRHSLSDDENAWADGFKGQLLSSHGITNSRGVLIAYLDSKSFTDKKRINDDTARFFNT